jgi:hypothetical protein
VILGINCNKHCGNVKFRQFIKAYKRARFQTNPKIAAAEAVKEVVSFWRNLSPPGRFLAQNRKVGDGQWHEVEEKQAMRIASFFLLDQNPGGEKRRQKSIDAKKEMQQMQMQMAKSSPSCFPNLMVGAEPVPIGSGSNMGRNGQQPVKMQQQNQQSFAAMPPSCNTGKKNQDVWDAGNVDLNPLPFQFNDEDFDPLPTSFNNGNCWDMPSNNKQFSGNPEQVQVSVNMVVNTMPQGSSKENAVNTVTNIQIGTINDNSNDRNQCNDFYASSCTDSFPVPNFQLTTDAPSSFIQISTGDPHLQNHGSGLDGNPHQMNDFQIGFFGNGNGNDSQNNSMGFNNRSLPENNLMTMEGNNMNMNGNMGSNINMNGNMGDMNMNGNMSGNSGNNGNGNNDLRWNKKKVANSVPCAASLVGSVFDDW